MIDVNRNEFVEIWYKTERRFEHPECFIQKIKYNSNKIPHIGDTIDIVSKKDVKKVKVVEQIIGDSIILMVEDVK